VPPHKAQLPHDCLWRGAASQPHGAPSAIAQGSWGEEGGAVLPCSSTTVPLLLFSATVPLLQFLYCSFSGAASEVLFLCCFSRAGEGNGVGL